MTVLTAADRAALAEIEWRLATITPGEWQYRQMAEVVYDAKLKPVCSLDWVDMTDADGFFIANAPADMRLLLDMIRRMGAAGDDEAAP